MGHASTHAGKTRCQLGPEWNFCAIQLAYFCVYICMYTCVCVCVCALVHVHVCVHVHVSVSALIPWVGIFDLPTQTARVSVSTCLSRCVCVCVRVWLKVPQKLFVASCMFSAARLGEGQLFSQVSGTWQQCQSNYQNQPASLQRSLDRGRGTVAEVPSLQIL